MTETRSEPEKPATGGMDVDATGTETQHEGSNPADEKVINEEYKIWKKNSPFLYDLVITHALEWPTLTLQWLPDRETPPSASHSIYRLLLGTHTSGADANYLQFASVQIPNPVAADANSKPYDEERGELGGHSNVEAPKFSLTQRIDHDGEVNRARYMPQNPDIVATLSPSRNGYIFDRKKHSLTPNGNFSPQMTLKGHEAEGFGLSWNFNKEGWLATGAEDFTVRLWDISGYSKANGGVITPYRTYRSHTGVVNDVQYHPLHDQLFASVSDDQMLLLHDVRKGEGSEPTRKVHAHAEAINAVAFHPVNSTVLATASADKTIGLWDLRNLKTKLHSFEGHDDEVTALQWSPCDEPILASAGADRRVLVWDMSRIGEEQTPEDADDGPPELLFMHGGHTSRVGDFGWFPATVANGRIGDPWGGWLLASAAEDNVLQVWSPSRNIWAKEDAVDADASELE